MSKVKSVSCVPPLHWSDPLNYKSVTGHGPCFINNPKWRAVCAAHTWKHLICVKATGNQLILTNAFCWRATDRTEGEQLFMQDSDGGSLGLIRKNVLWDANAFQTLIKALKGRSRASGLFLNNSSIQTPLLLTRHVFWVTCSVCRV